MKTQTNSAQNSRPAKRLKVDFSHRLTDSLSLEAALTDSIGLAQERALSILELLCLQFEDAEASRASDAVICSALYSVMAELEDIQAMTRAYWDAKAAKQQA